MASLLGARSGDQEEGTEEPGVQMSFMDHLDELRSRLIRSITFVFVVFIGCWFVSNYIYNFLARPVQHALAEAQRRELPLGGLTGKEQIQALAVLKEGDTARYTFSESTKIGTSVIPPGTSVLAQVAKDASGNTGLFMAEQLIAGNAVVPKGVRLPVDFNARFDGSVGLDEKLIVNTMIESFSLYIKVSLYTAICIALPFLLWQIWAFVSPGLYPHERGYVLPFILLSTISFFIGSVFAYYVIFPPAAKYLLGLGKDFRLFLKADDYFDFIILVMLGMGIVFQMPAITYVLARIGLVTAKYLIRIWRTSLIVILISAAILSPTNDVPNMLLFAAPMLVLYVISIFVAWISAKPRVRA
jgi:sec-independent protein translocase protein TatC